MTYPFKLTAKCPRMPDHWFGALPPKPVPHLSDEEVDQCLHFMINHGAHDMMLPATKYGRRVAVEAHLAYERVRPVFSDAGPWTPKNPTQPR